MIFPFKIQFERVVNIQIPSNIGDVIVFIRDRLFEDIGKESKIYIGETDLTFKMNNWLSDALGDMNGVWKGTFYINIENGILTLTYTYIIGSSFAYVTTLGIILTIIALFVSKKPIGATIHFTILIYSIFFSIFWLATLFKQNRMFRGIAKKIEKKWG